MNRIRHISNLYKTILKESSLKLSYVIKIVIGVTCKCELIKLLIKENIINNILIQILSILNNHTFDIRIFYYRVLVENTNISYE
jgi:hypothetical protein